MNLLIKYLFGFVLFFTVNIGIGQSISLHNTPKGTFVSVDKTTPGNVQGFIIERENSKTGELKRLIELKMPNSMDDMVADLQSSVEILSFTTHQLNHGALWDSLQSATLNPNNYMMNLPAVKLAVGTAFLDENTSEGTNYSYFLKDKSGKLIAKTGPFKYERSKDFPEITLYKVSEDLSNPVITWYTTAPGDIRDFETYRAAYGSTDFKQIQTIHQTYIRNDTLWLTMIDTTLEVEGLNLYFIIPKDHYGNKGTSKVAVQASNLTKRSLPVFTKLDASGHPNAKAMVIQWKISRKERTRSLQLYRSSTYDGEYRMVAELSTADSIYVDPVPVANENYYYYLQINDIFGVSRKSARFFGLFKGTIIPLPPKMVKADPIKGGVSLEWKSQDESIRGYYVLRGEGYTGEMEQISSFLPIQETEQIYIDTSSTLKGQSVYAYSVLAESDTYDKSDPSDTLFTRPGIKTTISAPMDLEVLLRDEGIRLIWSDHSKLEPYLAGYKVYRKSVEDDAFMILTDSLIPYTPNIFTDSTITLESKYQYAVTAIDYFGAESHQKVSGPIDLQGKLYKMPEDCWLERIDKGIKLKWVIPANKNLTGFKLYQATGDEGFREWKRTDPNIREMTDTDFEKGQTKFYRVSAIYTGDNESKKSLPVMVRF
jgi:hypothetical protein